MVDFAFEAEFPTSKLCRLKPFAKGGSFGFFLVGSPPWRSVTVGAVVSVGKVVIGIDVLGTVGGAFELLAGGVLGAAAKFGVAFGTLMKRTVSLPAAGANKSLRLSIQRCSHRTLCARQHNPFSIYRPFLRFLPSRSGSHCVSHVAPSCRFARFGTPCNVSVPSSCLSTTSRLLSPRFPSTDGALLFAIQLCRNRHHSGVGSSPPRGAIFFV